jgi:3-hydroxybutyryl-CoA dehydrogenase
MHATLEGWGLHPLSVKDLPGGIIGRITRAYHLESLRLLDEGVASVYEIDKVLTTHGKFAFGPFERMDAIGIDDDLRTTALLQDSLGGSSHYAPHAIQHSMVRDRHAGRRTGRGFYKYDHQALVPAYWNERKSFEVSPLLSGAMMAFTYSAGALEANSTEQFIFSRILASTINEAARIFDEGIAASDEIDEAMVRGAGFSRGPLALADEIGMRNVRGVLSVLSDDINKPAYRPAKLLLGD